LGEIPPPAVLQGYFAIPLREKQDDEL
jgi:hypothetical protein